MMTCEDCNREAMEFVAVAEGHMVCRECAENYFAVEKIVEEEDANIKELKNILEEWGFEDA